MRVLHIIIGLNKGGAEGVLFRLISQLHSEHEFSVISLLEDGFYSQHIRALKVPVYTLNLQQNKITLSSIIKLYKLIKEINPDVVQTWMYHADLIGGITSRLAGCNRILWNIRHARLSDDFSSFPMLVTEKVHALFSNVIPIKIIAGSNCAAITHKKPGFSKDKIVVIPNGYDLSQLYINTQLGDTVRKEWDVKREELLIGFVARWTKEKNHEHLLQAVKHLVNSFPTMKCVLVGVGLDADNIELKLLLKNLNIEKKVILAGSRDDINAVMNALDVHVLSSLSEGFPNVVAEAMACGTPCVVTNVGDAAMIVGETGWVVPKSDYQALAVAIAEALVGILSEGRRFRQDICRQRIKRLFSIEIVAQKYTQEWENSVDKQVQGKVLM